MNRLFLLIICLVFFVSCDSKKETLHIFVWSDYIKPELIERFEKEHDCTVVVDTFDSNESMFAKIKLGAGGYDILVPSNYFLEIMQKSDMLQPINKAALKNLSYIDPNVSKLVGKTSLRYGVPYFMTQTVIAWRKDKKTIDQMSWSIFADESLRGRMTLLNDVRETLGAALKFKGYSANTTNQNELQEAKDTLILWKKNLAKFESEQYKNGIASGEYVVVQGYSGDILQVMQEHDSVTFQLPVEGTIASMDFLVIPKKAEKVALAHEFINFLLDPEVAKENMNFTNYMSPNPQAIAMVQPRLKEVFEYYLHEDSLDKIELIKDLGPKVTQSYNKAWDEVKAA
jgi:spermidine/putrescine transport system substrate-binding protein